LEVKEALQKIKPQLFQIFDYLHENPELSWKEVNTTAFITDMLEKHSCKVTTFTDCTGVIGEWGEGQAPTVALRSDIDALWQEVNGKFQANHSCGHDAHMTIALGVLLLLKEMNYKPPGKLKFIFQPAEEKGTGALKFIEKGVVDDVDYLYGLHVRPIDESKNGQAAPAIMHGAAQFVSGEIIGTDAHGARPHQGNNAIEIGASFIQLLNSIHLNPSIPYSAKMTRFIAGGESSNIIPGKALFSLDLRAQTNEIMEQLIAKVKKIATTLAELNHVDIRLEFGGNTAAAIVHDEAKEIMKEAIVDTLGPNHVQPAIISTGGEDFHFYTLKRPHLKATMLGLGCDLQPGLHHPNMKFDKDAMINGVEILTKALMLTHKAKLKGE